MGTSPSVARSTGNARSGRLAALLLVCLIIARCRGAPTEPLVLLIAAEGVDPRLVEELLARDELPNIQRLVDRGSLAHIQSPSPDVPPVVWTTAATGRPPTSHGIDGFVVDGLPARSTQRREAAFWNLLPRLGVATAVVGWPVTWPAEPESGLVVSDRAHLERVGRMEPQGLVSMTDRRIRPRPAPGLDRFTSFALDMSYTELATSDPDHRLGSLVDHHLNRPLQRDRIYVEIALELLSAHDLDLLALGVRGVDSVSHGFWAYLPDSGAQRSGSNPPDGRFAGVIPAYYRYLDDIVGELLQASRRKVLVILVSDHGAGPARGRRARGLVSGAHRDAGALIISGWGAQRGVLQTRPITHQDILPTLLWITGYPQAVDLPGHPLRDYLGAGFAASASLPSVPTYRDALNLTRRSTPASTGDTLVIEEIESLGYLER